MLPALASITQELESLYLEKTTLATSKYAKKRIKVDVKHFIKNCCDPEKLKFSNEFKTAHFDLVSTSNSKIKNSLIKILEKRCNVKQDELATIAGDQKAPEEEKEEPVQVGNLMAKLKQNVQQEYQDEKELVEHHV